MENLSTRSYSPKIFLSGLAVVALGTAFEWFARWAEHPTTLQLSILLIQLSILILMAHKPYFGSFLMIALDVVWACLPNIDTAPAFYSEFLAIGVIAYRYSYRSFYIPIIAILFNFINVALYPNPYNTMTGAIGLSCVMCFSFYGGWSLSWKIQAEEWNRNRIKIEQKLKFEKQRSQFIASLHDSVSGNLAYVRIMAQEREKSSDDPFWGEVSKTMEQSLHTLRSISKDFQENEDFSKDIRLSSLSSLLEEGRRKLQNIGINGVIYFHDERHIPLRFDIDYELHSICNELIANLLKHCSKGRDSYVIDITISPSEIHIQQVNKIQVGIDPCLSSGTGLIYHKRIIEQLGGVISNYNEDSEWLLDIRIPLNSTKPN